MIEDKLETMMTTEEVCSFFHITRGTLRLWRKKGYLKAVKVGRRCLYNPDAIKYLITLTLFSSFLRS